MYRDKTRLTGATKPTLEITCKNSWDNCYIEYELKCSASASTTPYPTSYPTPYPTPYPTLYPTPYPTPYPTQYPDIYFDITTYPTPYPTWNVGYTPYPTYPLLYPLRRNPQIHVPEKGFVNACAAEAMAALIAVLVAMMLALPVLA
jgi:hypothetical protein